MPREVFFVVIDQAAAGDQLLAPIVGGTSVRLIGCTLVLDMAGTVRFESGANGDALTGVMTLATGIPLVLPNSENGWLECNKDEGLSLEVTGGQCSGVAVLERVAKS